MVRRIHTVANTVKQHLPAYLTFYGLFHLVVATLAVLGKYLLPDFWTDIPDVILFLLLFFGCLVVLLFGGNKEYPPVIFPELRKTEFRLLIVFFIIAAVNTFCAWMAQGGSPYAHFSYIFFAAANIFASYPLGAYLGRSGRDLCFRRVMRLLTWGSCMFILFGVIWVFIGDPAAKASSHFYVSGGRGRLWLNVNPNTTGMLCCLLLMMLPYSFYGMPRGKKILSVVLTGAVLLGGLLFTDCRGAILALGIGVSLACGVYLWEKYSHLSVLKRLCIVIAGMGAIWIVLFVGRQLFRQQIALLLKNVAAEKERLLALRSTLGGAAGKEHPFAPAAVTLGAKGTDAIQSPLSAPARLAISDRNADARLRIWKSAFISLKNNPSYILHGCGLVEISQTLAENGCAGFDDTHNQLLDILLGLGLPTFLLFMGWLLLLGKKCLQLGLCREQPWARRILPVVILAILICNMFEARILFFRWTAGDVFFLLAGYIFGLMEKRKPGKEQMS